MSDIIYIGPFAFYFDVHWSDHIKNEKTLQAILSPSPKKGQQQGGSYSHKLISFCIYDSPQDPLVAAVWEYTSIDTASFVPLEFKQATAVDLTPPQSPEFTSLIQKKFYPLFISATGTNASDTKFGIAFKHQTNSISITPKATPVMVFDVPVSQLPSTRFDPIMPTSVTIYRSILNSEPMFAATFWPRSFTPWNWDLSGNIFEFQERHDVFAKSPPVPIRLEMIARLRLASPISPVGDYYLALWFDDKNPHQDVLEPDHKSMTRGEFKQLVNDLKAGNLGNKLKAPIRIHATGLGADVCFTAILGTSDSKVPRTWQVVGGAPNDLFTPFDIWMKNVMQGNSIRAGQLAIVRQGALVCARAYTWAETSAGYPITGLKDSFRVESISKAITHLAAIKVLDPEDPNPGSIKLPPGAGNHITDSVNLKIAGLLHKNFLVDFSDPLFSLVRVKHILTHRSGISEFHAGNTEFTLSDITLIPVPLSPQMLTPYALAQPNIINPAPTKTFGVQAYKGYETMLLTRAIERMSAIDSAGGSQTSYEDIARDYLFLPLGIMRPNNRGANGPNPGEVICHSNAPTIGQSHGHADRRLVHGAYGTSSFLLESATGGWVMAAIDLARVLAAISLGLDLVPSDASNTNNLTPLLSQSALNFLFELDSINLGPSNNLIGGYTNAGWLLLQFGFISTPLGNIFMRTIGHNGADALKEDMTLMFLRTDGLAGVVFFNGLRPGGLGLADVNALQSIADLINWPATVKDLFNDVDNW
jgi:CubicO group peptidase (beta-lactamase class C family)